MSLIVTLVIAASASVLVGGVLFYTASQTNLTRRIGQYENSLNTAVTATEKVVTSITRDFMSGGESKVSSSIETYAGMIPTPEDVTAGAVSTISTGNSGPGSMNSGSGSGGIVSGVVSPILSPVTDLLDPNGVKRWKKFDFTDIAGNPNRTHVERLSEWSYRELRAKFPGLRGFAADYTVISNVREKDKSYRAFSSVKQEVQIASVPLCQFQFFYVPDM